MSQKSSLPQVSRFVSEALMPDTRKINGSVLMVPKKPHRNTVDRQQIEERFKELGLNLDWSKLQELARIRNDAEHLFMTARGVQSGRLQL